MRELRLMVWGCLGVFGLALVGYVTMRWTELAWSQIGELSAILLLAALISRRVTADA